MVDEERELAQARLRRDYTQADVRRMEHPQGADKAHDEFREAMMRYFLNGGEAPEYPLPPPPSPRAPMARVVRGEGPMRGPPIPLTSYWGEDE